MKQWRKFVVLALAMLCASSLAPTVAYAETPGKDGDLTVSTAVTINQYAALSASAVATNTSVTVVSLSVNLAGLQPGDLIMIYQAQGAAISTTDSAAYGAVTALNNAGRWEYQTVGSVVGDTINLAGYGGQCSGLRNSYDLTGKPQVLRVPQYRNLTITAGGSINAAQWNGTTGGVVSVHVSGTLANAGAISADAAGFRGGAINNNSGANYNITGFRTTDANQAGTKGESIAGYQTEYDSLGGRYGRGAPANGGGGGNAHNAGGGGGANGDNGNTWAGQGVPDNSNGTWAAAWNIDGTLTSTTSNSGGGRGDRKSVV